jgi:drug/metabolite transporter (DMT)-like permease
MMGSLAPLLIGLLTSDVKSAANRAKRLAILYALAGLLCLFGFGALTFSGGLYLSRRMPPETAALIIAAVLFALSMVILAAASIWTSKERSKASRSRSIGPAVAATAALAVLPALLSNRVGAGIAGALALGYAYANRKPPIRRHGPVGHAD